MKVVSPFTAIIYGYKAEVKLMQMFFRNRAVWGIFVVGGGKVIQAMQQYLVTCHRIIE